MDPCDVVVVGGGRAGPAVARQLATGGLAVTLLNPPVEREAPEGVTVLEDPCAVGVLLSPGGSVAGVQCVAMGDELVVRARAVVLATGGVRGLFPGAPATAGVGLGMVLAHRTGALVDATLEWVDGAPRLSPGVVTDGEGRTNVPGLYAAGATAGGVDPGAVAKAALHDVGADPTPPPVGDRRVLHAIDAPLPEGFAEVKLERLRRVMAAHLTPDGPKDLHQLDGLLHALKGEADDFARARLDPQLHGLQAAVEAAILVTRGATAG